ncbi:MAG: hypothetical protein HYY23_07600 [Verrucomicrobia bacterium]|nr:hypothetical protein [Verrucomicrobiota bacterium]
MAETPENNMDQLLKACARQRREEAGPALEMPEATRRVLQAEVARTFPKSKTAEPPAWLRLFAGFWPRLAFGSGLVAVLAIAALVSFRTERNLPPSFELAQNTEQERLTTPQQAAPAPSLEASDRKLDLSRSSAAPPRTEPSQTIERELVQAPAPAPQEGLARLSEDVTRLSLNPAPPSAPITADSLSKAEKPGGFAGDKFGMADGLAKKDTPTPETTARQSGGATPASASTPALTARANAVESLARASDKATLGREVKERAESLADNKALADRSAKAAATELPRSETVLVARAPEAQAAIVSNAAQPYYFQNSAARGLTEKESGVPRLQFSQIDNRARLRSNRNSPPPITNVLNSFQVQRQGSNILVLDADGSVYEGTVQALSQGLAAPSVGVALKKAPTRAVQTAQSRFQNDPDQFQKQPSAVGNAAEIQGGENFSFSAAGTNRSLNQKVVFTGNYVIRQNERIEGKATVGGKIEFPIEALRVGPQP